MPAGDFPLAAACPATGCMAGVYFTGTAVRACPVCQRFDTASDAAAAVTVLLGALAVVCQREGETVADALDTVVDRAMATVLHVVTGRTGEYDDQVEWPVRAFPQEADARGLVARLTAWCDERGLGEDPTQEWDRTVLPPEDHGFRWKHTGTRYSIVEVMLDAPVTAP